jgi:hypothetical protein
MPNQWLPVILYSMHASAASCPQKKFGDHPHLEMTAGGALAPTLDGLPLALGPNERSRSLAFAPDGARFVLGTEWSLRLFERIGRQLWHKSGPRVAGTVNVTGDGFCATSCWCWPTSDGCWYCSTPAARAPALCRLGDRRKSA